MLELRTLPAIAIETSTRKISPGVVGIHVHVSIASERDAVQARATAGGASNGSLAQTSSWLFQAQPQDSGAAVLVTNADPSGLPHIVAKGVIAG